tara:strand:- start:2122 stop:4041 length:1920 start_codon:yes stop_codon:yes gene_type:complete
MSEKILITTKQGYDFSSDSTGGNLINILIAEYFQDTTNFTVDLFDPFYDLSSKVNTKFKVFTEISDSKLRSYDRILDPFFYISSVKNFKNNKFMNFFSNSNTSEIQIEGRKKWKEYFSIKKKDIKLIQKNGFMSSNTDDENLYYKSLPTPYTHYYELLYRDNFKSNLSLKKKITIPLQKNKLTFSIQIRPIHHNKTTIKDNLSIKKYYEFISLLTNKINKEYNFPNIIFFGETQKEFNNIIKINKKIFANKNIFLLENYSKTVIENSLTLAKNTDFLISSLNGFAAFTYFIGSSQGKTKKKIVINSINEAKEHIISRRILQQGINENNADWKWFKTFDYYPKDTILKVNKKDLIDNKKIKLDKKKIKLVFYETNDLVRNYFTKELDKLLMSELINYVKKNYKKKIIFLSRKKNKLSKDVYNKIQKNLNILSHFNLVDNTNKQSIGVGSLDFIKHEFLKSTQKRGLISPSHYLYEDISFFLIRELLKKKNDEIKTKKNIKRVLLIFSSENDYENFSKHYETIKKFNLDLSYVYKNESKLVFLRKKNKFKYDLNKKNILKIISKNDCLICGENHLSLFFSLFNKNKKIFFYFKNRNSKIFSDNCNLFQSTNNLNYRKLFINNYNNYYEIFLAITKIFIKRF